MRNFFRIVYHSINRIGIIKNIQERVYLIKVSFLKLKKDNKVSLLIIGTQKGGTTFLHDYLKTNFGYSDSFYRKEVHFFDKYYSRGYNWFEKQFPSKMRLLDSSPSYSIVPNLSEKVLKYNKDIKIIFIKRDPIDRAVSHYRHNIKRGFLTKKTTFEEALAIEKKIWGKIYFDQNIKLNDLKLTKDHLIHSYYIRGLYNWQLNSWEDKFEKQILIIDFSTLKKSKNLNIILSHFLDLKIRNDNSTLARKNNKNSYVWAGKIDKNVLNRIKTQYINDSRY